MNYLKYQQAALLTAIYPNKGHNLAYAVLGLTEETGEAFHMSNFQRKSKEHELFLKELGDILWYVNATAYECGSSLVEVMNLETPVFPVGSIQELMTILFFECSVVSGRAKKLIRDHNGTVTDEKKATIRQSLNNIMQCLELIAAEAESTLQQVAELNIEKLQGRKSSGTLKGDGDVR
jgi:NTP pyrophosphatase (non-canonical NTP hydrolase)